MYLYAHSEAARVCYDLLVRRSRFSELTVHPPAYPIRARHYPSIGPGIASQPIGPPERFYRFLQLASRKAATFCFFCYRIEIKTFPKHL